MSERSPLIPRVAQYGRPSAMEKIKTFFTLLPLPLVLLWTVLFRKRGRGCKRAAYIRAIRYVITSLNVAQVQHLFGTTRGAYDRWIKAAKVEPVSEPITMANAEEITKLLWVGERTLDKVIIYLHGGGFLLPPADTNLAFLHHVRTRLKERGINVSIAMVQYDLVPATFPTPLKQAVAAINHLMELGVDPQNMQLIGDSAGGNLILQLLGHLVHPLESERVSPFSLSAPFKGAYLMSPWVDLSDIFQTFERGDGIDMLSSSLLKYWGSLILEPVPAKHRDYIEANSAVENWWKGVDAFVDRVLITAGEGECLKDEIIRFRERFKEFHSNVKFVEHTGVHNDPMVEFITDTKNGEEMNMIVDWLTEGFQEVATGAQ